MLGLVNMFYIVVVFFLERSPKQSDKIMLFVQLRSDKRSMRDDEQGIQNVIQNEQSKMCSISTIMSVRLQRSYGILDIHQRL